MKDLIRSIKNLSSKIMNSYPDFNPGSLDRLKKLLVELYEKSNEYYIDEEDVEIIDAIISDINNTRKKQAEPIIDIVLCYYFIWSIKERVEKNHINKQ